eukprot:m.114945 g.114945  ORF g.114945 m.114945 type:complete len:365 (-) comp16041_c0_seq1:205-1299(-)
MQASTNRFGFDLFRRLTATDTNVFISPLSITQALAMVATAATPGSAAEAELVAALGLSYADPAVQAAMNEAVDALQSAADIELLVANSVWARPEMTPEFSTALASFNAEAHKITSAAEINAWVAKSTKNCIKSVIDSISKDTVCLLINAVYFKGAWKTRFEADNTYDDIFHIHGGRPVPCRMMKREMAVPCLFSDKVEVASLPYKGDRFSAVLVKPVDASVEAMNALINDLSNETWKSWVDSLHSKKILVEMPRFKMEFGVRSLKAEMIAMQMPNVFAEGQMNRAFNDSTVYVDDVLHKAVLKVNEKGTVAAAATVVRMRKKCKRASDQEIFRLDRPFLFSVYDNEANLVLFIGKVDRPEDLED